MSGPDDIVRLQRELAEDPRSLRFVQLADALRVDGRTAEAERYCDRGFRFILA